MFFKATKFAVLHYGSKGKLIHQIIIFSRGKNTFLQLLLAQHGSKSKQSELFTEVIQPRYLGPTHIPPRRKLLGSGFLVCNRILQNDNQEAALTLLKTMWFSLDTFPLTKTYTAESKGQGLWLCSVLGTLITGLTSSMEALLPLPVSGCCHRHR